MLVVYNIFQPAALVLLFPLLLLVVLWKAKYRLRIPARLGFGLAELVKKIPPGKNRIWIHALSLGEAASSVSLIHALHREFPDTVLIFSSTTLSGEKFIRNLPGLPVDLFLRFPLDIAPVVNRFIKMVRPDLFVLVETDFWPNFLHGLKKNEVGTLLINGRISQKSYTRYARFQPFFLPMFNSFSVLAVQRRQDVEKMMRLGVAEEKIQLIGNLKYDALLPDIRQSSLGRRDFGIDEDRFVLVAGSTHPGEEEMLCGVFAELVKEFAGLLLVIAPRNIGRGPQILDIFTKKGFRSSCRTVKPRVAEQILVLDTHGELAGLYGLADLAFVGGSLVDKRGHNPLEPAAAGTPVFFGPYMDDFADEVEDLLAEKCAVQVRAADDLLGQLRFYLLNKEAIREMGQSAQDFVMQRRGVTKRYIDLIRQVMS